MRLKPLKCVVASVSMSVSTSISTTMTVATAMAVATVVSFSAVPTLAMASDGLTTPAFTQCMGKADADAEIMDCVSAETQRQDARLNQIYKSLGDGLSPARKAHLLDAQRAWIKFRDTNCRFYLDPQGGTVAQLLAADCVLRLTAERAQELESFVQ